jgi:cyclo(L-tyrosyl-L-tyrosyl) synthase
MRVNYATERCKSVFDRRHHAVLGISPFNSYFSEQQIAYLYQWASLNFKTVQLYVPDVPTVFTLQALGYEDKKAKKKANRQCSYLKNKIFRALDSCGIEENRWPSFLICHSNLNDNVTYQKKYAWCCHQYEKDPVFREGCLSSSKWVLSNQLSEGQEPTEMMLATAVKYFLAELPMFLWSPEILNKPSTAFCYHQCPDFLRQLFNGVCGDELVHEEQGFLIIEPK